MNQLNLLKENLINKIRASENSDLLEELYKYFTIQNNIEETFQFNYSQKNDILIAKEQINKGYSIPNDKANKEIDEWLEEE